MSHKGLKVGEYWKIYDGEYYCINKIIKIEEDDIMVLIIDDCCIENIGQTYKESRMLIEEVYEHLPACSTPLYKLLYGEE